MLARLHITARPLDTFEPLVEPFFFDWMHQFLCWDPRCECLGPFGVRLTGVDE